MIRKYKFHTKVSNFKISQLIEIILSSYVSFVISLKLARKNCKTSVRVQQVFIVSVFTYKTYINKPNMVVNSCFI